FIRDCVNCQRCPKRRSSRRPQQWNLLDLGCHRRSRALLLRLLGLDLFNRGPASCGRTGATSRIFAGFPEMLAAYPEMLRGFPKLLRAFPKLPRGFPKLLRGLPQLLGGFPEMLRGTSEMVRGTSEMLRGTSKML